MNILCTWNYIRILTKKENILMHKISFLRTGHELKTHSWFIFAWLLSRPCVIFSTWDLLMKCFARSFTTISIFLKQKMIYFLRDFFFFRIYENYCKFLFLPKIFWWNFFHLVLLLHHYFKIKKWNIYHPDLLGSRLDS